MCYRDYFGEKTGIYFAWLGRCLCTLYVYHILGAGNNMICILEKKKNSCKKYHVNCKLPYNSEVPNI